MANPPDFELLAGLRARVLVSRVPPNAVLETEGEEVALEYEGMRERLPEEMREGASYSKIAVEKRVVGRLGHVRRKRVSRGPS